MQSFFNGILIDKKKEITVKGVLGNKVGAGKVRR